MCQEDSKCVHSWVYKYPTFDKASCAPPEDFITNYMQYDNYFCSKCLAQSKVKVRSYSRPTHQKEPEWYLG